MVFKLEGGVSQDALPAQETWVFVDHLDAHLARAEAGGAKIVRGLHQTGSARM